jgi:polyisoprenyl-teichoic acid--peptidoglycan teichoic acid transferase
MKWHRSDHNGLSQSANQLDNVPARPRFVVFWVTIYALAVIVGTGLASSWVYDWARIRMLNNSQLAELADWNPAVRLVAPKPAMEQPDLAEVAPSHSDGATEERSSAPVVVVPAINVLLLGTDQRPGENDIPRTDTMILLSLDPTSQTAGMLSLPRDLWVPIPGFSFSTKINTAYPIGETRGYPGGGAQLAKDTVSSFIGQPIQYYVRINFQGFVEMIDLIGGVDVIVPKTIYDDEYPTEDYGTQIFYLEAGKQHLNGETALKYVRTRNVDDDYGRARRQQDVIRGVVDKVLRADMLPTLLTKLPRLLYTMSSSIETDIPPAMQLEFASYIRETPLQEVRQLVLDSAYGEETYSEEGAWILLPDRTKVRSALAKFFEPGPIVRSKDATNVVNPAWIRVEVLNGTGQPGVAARTRELLESQGWQVVSIGDADRNDYVSTLIINYGIPHELVEKVGMDLELEPNLASLRGLNGTSPVDVRIVVGRDILDHLK